MATQSLSDILQGALSAGPSGYSGYSGYSGSGISGFSGGVGPAGPIGPKTIGVALPTTLDKVVAMFTTGGGTISKLVAVLPGGTTTPSVTYSVRYGTDVSAAGTEVVTAGSTVTSVSTGTTVTSFNSATVPASNFVWVTFSAVSGTVPMFSLTIEF